MTKPRFQPESPSVLVCPHTQAQPKRQAPPKDSFHLLYRTVKENINMLRWAVPDLMLMYWLLGLHLPLPSSTAGAPSLLPGCHRKCSFPRKPIIRYLLVFKAGPTHTNSSPCFGFLGQGQECLSTALTPGAVHPSGITTSPALPDVVHGKHPKPRSTAHNTPENQDRGYPEPLEPGYPHIPTSTIAAGRQREPGDSTLGIGSISASPNHTFKRQQSGQ